MTLSNSYAQLKADVERKECELRKAKVRRDGTITGHEHALKALRTEQLKAEASRARYTV